MCNDYGNRVPYQAYVEEFSRLQLPILSPGAGAAPNLEARDEIWPTEVAPVVCAEGHGVALRQVAWGLAPARPKGPVVINLRSEGRRFERGRCLVPASHYFEFTGARSPKVRWKFTTTEPSQTGADWFCFAGLLGRGSAGEAFALITAAAGPDVVALHARQPVVLARGSWRGWLAGEDGLLLPSPAGSLQVERSVRPAAGLLL